MYFNTLHELVNLEDFLHGTRAKHILIEEILKL